MAVQFGSVPEWVAAVGTSGSLMVAAALLGIELRRRRSERATNEEDQARMICWWMMAGTTGEGSTFGITIMNASDLPVHSALFTEKGSHFVLGVLPPQSERYIDYKFSVDQPTDVVNVLPETFLEFWDVKGAGWERGHSGELRRSRRRDT